MGKGELFREIPKATGAKGNQYTAKWNSRSGAENPKPKREDIEELGFSADQANRLETLAKNPNGRSAGKRRNSDMMLGVLLTERWKRDTEKPWRRIYDRQRTAKEIFNEIVYRLPAERENRRLES